MPRLAVTGCALSAPGKRGAPVAPATPGRVRRAPEHEAFPLQRTSGSCDAGGCSRAIASVRAQQERALFMKDRRHLQVR